MFIYTVISIPNCKLKIYLINLQYKINIKKIIIKNSHNLYLRIHWISSFFIALILNMFFANRFIKYNFDYSIISYIGEDLDSKLIYNLNQRDKCEEGEEILILGTWFGSSNKCNVVH